MVKVLNKTEHKKTKIQLLHSADEASDATNSVGLLLKLSSLAASDSRTVLLPSDSSGTIVIDFIDNED